MPAKWLIGALDWTPTCPSSLLDRVGVKLLVQELL